MGTEYIGMIDVKLGKIRLTMSWVVGLLMGLSIGSTAWSEFGWAYPLYFLSLLIHEFGHAFTMLKFVKDETYIDMGAFSAVTAGVVDPTLRDKVTRKRWITFYMIGPILGVFVCATIATIAGTLGSIEWMLLGILGVGIHCLSFLPWKTGSDLRRMLLRLDSLKLKLHHPRQSTLFDNLR